MSKPQKTITRRTLLAATAAGSIAALPVAVSATSTDPHVAAVADVLRLYKEHEAASELHNEAMEAAAAAGLPSELFSPCDSEETITPYQAKLEHDAEVAHRMASLDPAAKKHFTEEHAALLRERDARHERNAVAYKADLAGWAEADARFGISEKEAAYNRLWREFVRKGRELGARPVTTAEGAIAVAVLSGFFAGLGSAPEEEGEDESAILMRRVVEYARSSVFPAGVWPILDPSFRDVVFGDEPPADADAEEALS